MADVVINLAFIAGLPQTPGVRAACHAAGQLVAREAERIGQDVSGSYTAEVEDGPEGVRVAANTRALNAASWIEFGSANNPPYAPLRRGAEAAGLRSEGTR